MDKQEFVMKLRRNLSGIDDYEYVNDTVNYYENYIEAEVRKGETEEAVLRMLGDPGLIAKSIKASRSEITSTAGTETSESTRQSGFEGKGDWKFRFIQKIMSMPPWALRVGGLAVGILLISILAILIQWLFPVLVVGGIAYIFYKFVRDNFMS